ncbi:MAG: hypothetical protein WCA49_19110 [Candidatus Sulfotelmatobacter sp.]
MSANANVLRRSAVIGSSARDTAMPLVEAACEKNTWDPEDFARQQIRGLVRRVFFAGGARAVKQVVFSAVEAHIDVASICEQAAQALALETHSHVALVDPKPEMAKNTHCHLHSRGTASIKSWSTQMAVNLWRVPERGLGECGEESGTGLHWLSCLAELRNEFEYVVIPGPAAGISSEAALLGQLTDGIILVLGAHSTRRAAALKIKETLEGAQSRILGTVLSERTFPIPERVYRRL